MAFSSDSIRRKAKSLEEYEKGRDLFRAGNVELLSSESFWKGEEKLKTEVMDGEQCHKTTLLIKGDCVYQAGCDCPVHKEYKGLCRHEVASAFYAMEKKEEKIAPHVSTPPQVRRMIHTYANREMSRLMAEKMEEKVHILPVFRFAAGRLFLYLKIGIERYYLIRDLSAFVEAMESDAYVEYGKKLGFYHSLDAFDSESAKLAEEIIRTVSEYIYAYEKANPLKSGTPQIKEMELSPGACDSFMKLLTGQQVEFEVPGKESRMIQIRKENPRLFGVIRTLGRDGARIALLDEIITFYGKRKLYLVRDDVLYCCDRGCTGVLREFFRAMTLKDGTDTLSMEMSMKDLPVFCDYVLPSIRKYVSLESMGIDLEQYHTPPLQSRFYFDSESPNEVTLQVEFWYGDEYFTPFDKEAQTPLYRDQVGELLVGTLIKRYFTARYAGENVFVLKDDEAGMYELLSNGFKEFRKYGEVFLSESMEERKVITIKPMTANVSMEGEWLNLSVDTGGISQAELMRILNAYRRKQKYYRMKSGDFMKISDSGFGTLSELYKGLGLDEKQSIGSKITLPAYRSLYLDKVLKEGPHVEVTRDSAFKSLVRNMNSMTEADFEIPETLKNTLREYQKHGFPWFRNLDYYGFGGILADDMGLGKTIQVISLLVDEAQKNKDMKALIVCPASLIYNWENELTRFGEELKVCVVTGTAAERQGILKEAKDLQVYITSYDLLRRDLSFYKEMNFRFQIIDEAQYIKNHTTQNARAVKKIQAKTKFALTGTPIENRLEDLWSIFDYLMPGFLFTNRRFHEEFENPITKEGNKQTLKRLHRIIGPFILRRYKKDVLKDLPDKLENVVYSRMEKEQKNLYAANVLALKQKLEHSEEEQFRREKLQILSELTRLRQICCDPELCYEDYKGSAAKLETCTDLVSGAVEGGHKILIFSQFTSMLDIIGERLSESGIEYYKLTGQTGKEERIELVGSFNRDEVPVFLISLKAGGTGLNLTAADMVIHFDPWWNLAAQNQATDRAHRIGQKKVVTVFKLIAKDTIEEGILKLQEQKRMLTDQVIENEVASFGNLDKEELMAILTGDI